MNYKKIYNSIIKKAKNSSRYKTDKFKLDYVYYEAHHIIPKCLGGQGLCSEWKYHENIVLLTPKEHFICHLLLTKIYPNNNLLIFALWMMCNTTKTKTGQSRYVPSSKLYEDIKIKKSKLKLTKEHILKLSKSKIGNKNGSGNKGKKHDTPSEETKRKIGNSNKGRIHNDISKLNMSKAHIGNKHSEETKQKMRGKRGPQKNPKKISII